MEYLKGDAVVDFEQRLIQDYDDFKVWLEYIAYLETLPQTQDNLILRDFVLNRACTNFPRSYKLWTKYLEFRVSMMRKPECNKSSAYRIAVKELFKRGLKYLNKFPRIWTRYLQFLVDYETSDWRLIRRVFNDSLCNLPYTQHEGCWQMYFEYLENSKSNGIECGKELLREAYVRYLRLRPELLETVLDKLYDFNSYKDYIEIFEAKVLDNPAFHSDYSTEKSKLEIYLQYFDVLVNYLSQLDDHGIQGETKVTNVMQTMIKKYPDQLGAIVVQTAHFYILKRNFAKAGDIFSQYVDTCLTIKDFTMIYDAYLEFKEARIQAQLEEQPQGLEQAILDMDMKVYEDLIKNREHYVLNVLIRQDKNNCFNWIKKLSLYNEADQKELRGKINCFVDAIKSIKPEKAHYDDYELIDGSSGADTLSDKILKQRKEKLSKTSGLQQIWIDYAQLYARMQDISTARQIFKTSIKLPFINGNDLTDIYISWAEMEVEHEGFEQGLAIIEEALKQPPDGDHVNYFDNEVHAYLKIHKSAKLWSFYLDLVESQGNFESTCEAYERVLKLKILTPVILINYVTFLEEHNEYEKSFQVLQVGLEKFKYYPVRFEISGFFLKKMIKWFDTEFQGKNFKITEQIRDLFEDSIAQCPSNLVYELYIMYINFEMSFGTKLRVSKIFKNCIKHLHLNPELPVPENFTSLSIEKIIELQYSREQKGFLPNHETLVAAYKEFLVRQRQINGLEACRSIYNQIFDEPSVAFNNVELAEFVLGFKDLETKLKEPARARAIFEFGVAYFQCTIHDPKLKMKMEALEKKFWDEWKNFELEFGNEDTFKEMLRTKLTRR